jgi:hypothetical protein
MTVNKIGWCLAPIIYQKKGITPGALMKKKQRGELIEGLHWKKTLGRIWYHYEKFDELIDSAA